MSRVCRVKICLCAAGFSQQVSLKQLAADLSASSFWRTLYLTRHINSRVDHFSDLCVVDWRVLSPSGSSFHRCCTWYCPRPDLAKTILQGTVKGGRRQGGQKKRWEDNIRVWTGLESGRSHRVVENREKWGKIICGAPTTLAVKELLMLMIMGRSVSSYSLLNFHAS